ncbi:MAG: extracellular solute-binding protein [Desulfobacteraceae bacterium]|nr:extracellular solute-binding protein [Desulfobacteraceae bacterium]
MGEDAAFFFFKKLYKNRSPYIDSHTRRVSRGQFGVAITFVHEAVEEMAFKKKHNLKIIYPKEGTGYEIGGISLIKNGPNAEIAKQFINFVLSESAQRLFVNSYYQLPVRLDVQKYSLASSGSDKIKLIDYDFSWAGRHRQHLIDRYKKEILVN